MDFQCLTPALERLLLDEVHHLQAHRRGSPHRNPNPSEPRSSPSNPNLRPLSSTAFKKECRKQRRETKRRQKWQQLQQLYSNPIPDPSPKFDRNPAVSDIQWPCEPTPAPNPETTGWSDPAPKLTAARPTPPASAEELARITAVQAQHNGMRVCQDFLSKNDGNGSDDGEGDDEDDAMGDDEGEEDGGESGTFNFFMGLFEKDGDLRGFYEKNWEKGEFCCLVCGGIGAKVGKRFVNCAGLVQHSNTIYKTKRRGAHRSFGRAVCRVLGWDGDRPPSSVLNPGEPVWELLARAANPQENVQKEESMIEKGPHKEAGESIEIDNGDLMEYLETNEITNLPEMEVEVRPRPQPVYSIEAGFDPRSQEDFLTEPRC